MKEIKDFIKKAEKFLKTAKLAFEGGDYDSCVSRCYYAMFFMVEAILLTKGISSSSHKGVISLFGKYFIKTNVFNREMGKALSDAYDKRIVGDYGVGLTVSKEEGKNLLEVANFFVQRIKDFLVNELK